MATIITKPTSTHSLTGGTAYHTKGADSLINQHDTKWLKQLTLKVGKAKAERCWHCYYRSQSNCKLANMPIEHIELNRCNTGGDPYIDTNNVREVVNWRLAIREDFEQNK